MQEEILGASHARAPTPTKPPLMPPLNIYLPVTIDFDSVASGTALDTAYQPNGVSLASLLGGTTNRGSAFAMQLQIGTAQTGKNVLSLANGSGWGQTFFDATDGAVEISFSQLQQTVTIWAFSVPTTEPVGPKSADNRPFIDAFSANGTYIGKARTQFGPADPNFFGQWHPIVFTSATRNIKNIRVSAQFQGSPKIPTVFDTLTFDRPVVLRR